MKQKGLALAVAIVLALTVFLPAAAMAQLEQRAGRFYLGGEAGAVFGTDDGTALGLAVVGDYFIDQNLSIGPLAQVALTSRYFHLAPSAQLKYTLDLDQRIKANVQGGIGFIYAENTRGPRDRDDTSFLIPVGGGLEYRFTDDIILSTTALFNFTDLDRLGERFFFSLLGGVKFRF